MVREKEEEEEDLSSSSHIKSGKKSADLTVRQVSTSS